MRKPETASRKTPPVRLTARAEFLRAGRGRRLRTRCFSLQMVGRPQGADEAPPRFGFTVTKKLGNAALRNRIRRRLKEALRCAPVLSARPGCDYVIVAQPGALTENFADLQRQLDQALADIHAAPRPREKNPRSPKD